MSMSSTVGLQTLQRLTRARSSNKQDYARTKSVDLDIPVMGYAGGKLSPRRGSRIPLSQRFNIMRRHTAASIFAVGDSPSSSSASPTKKQISTRGEEEEQTKGTTHEREGEHCSLNQRVGGWVALGKVCVN